MGHLIGCLKYDDLRLHLAWMSAVLNRLARCVSLMMVTNIPVQVINMYVIIEVMQIMEFFSMVISTQD